MKIKLTAPVRHGQQDLAVGDEIDLPEAQAQRLINLGVAQTTKGQPEAATAVLPEVSGEQLNTTENGAVATQVDEDELPDLEAVLSFEAPEKMTKEELETELAGLGIEYRPSASKAALVALVKQHRSQE